MTQKLQHMHAGSAAFQHRLRRPPPPPPIHFRHTQTTPSTLKQLWAAPAVHCHRAHHRQPRAASNPRHARIGEPAAALIRGV